MRSSSISNTDDKLEFLRAHMLPRFCLKWPTLLRQCDKFGDDSVLGEYSRELAGRGFKKSDIQSAIEICLNNKMYPSAKEFRTQIEGRGTNRSDYYQEPKKPFTKADAERSRHLLQSLSERGADAIAMHQALGTNFNNKDHYRGQIEKVAQALLGNVFIEGAA